MKQTTIALGAAMTIALAGLAEGALASPRSTSGFSHLQDLNALNISQQRQSALHAYPTHLLELEALARTAAAWARRYPPHGITTTHRGQPGALSGTRLTSGAAGSSGGFDWTDAGIGGAGGFALALVLTGGLLGLQRGTHRNQIDVPGT
jgi:hypothetical protein